MDADTFVRNLWACAPPAHELRRVGVSEATIEQIRASHQCNPRPGSKHFDPILDLMSRFDVSTLDIASIHLFQEPSETSRYWYIGEEEAEPLVIDRTAGEIQVVEEGTNGHVLWRCAAGSGQFLSALLHAAGFLSRCAYEDGLYLNKAEACRVAVECTELAGGEAYAAFLHSLVGCYNE